MRLYINDASNSANPHNRLSNRYGRCSWLRSSWIVSIIVRDNRQAVQALNAA